MRRKKISVYWAGMAIYTAVLLALGGMFLIYTDRCLVQYEYSQPESAMGRYLAEFERMAADGTLCDNIDMPAVESDFEPDDTEPPFQFNEDEFNSLFS